MMRMSEAEIEAMKERIEGEIKEVEELAFTYEVWLQDWRKRMAEKGKAT